jgi:uncharacterized protein with HEPN domain
MRTDSELVADILEAISNIERYSGHGKARFIEDELVQVWTLHHLQILGEAVRKLSEDYKAAHPTVPWNAIIGMRNILVHSYFGIDLEAVWGAVERDLPELKKQLS